MSETAGAVLRRWIAWPVLLMLDLCIWYLLGLLWHELRDESRLRPLGRGPEGGK